MRLTRYFWQVIAPAAAEAGCWESWRVCALLRAPGVKQCSHGVVVCSRSIFLRFLQITRKAVQKA